MSQFCIIFFGKATKKVERNNLNQENICNLLKITDPKSVIVKYYDNDVSEYIDVENWEFKSFMNKIKIIENKAAQQEHEMNEELPIERQDTLKVSNVNLDMPSTSTSSTSNLQRQNAVKLTDSFLNFDDHEIQLNDDDPFMEQESINLEELEQGDNSDVNSSSASEDNIFKDLETPYNLPEIDSNSKLGQILSKKEKLSKGGISLFLDKIYYDFTKHKK